jgi:hypothetical protein
MHKWISKEVQMANKYIFKCSIYLAIREINANQKLHWDSTSLQSEWWSSRTQTTNNTGEDAGWKRNYTWLVGMLIRAATMGISMEVPVKTELVMILLYHSWVHS